jgi:hypothetical protein
MGSKRLGVRRPATIARKSIVIDRRTWLHREQRQQTNEMPGLKEDVEMVCWLCNPVPALRHYSFLKIGL